MAVGGGRARFCVEVGVSLPLCCHALKSGSGRMWKEKIRIRKEKSRNERTESKDEVMEEKQKRGKGERVRNGKENRELRCKMLYL